MVCWIQFNSVHYETECQMIWKLICLILKLSLNSKQGQLIFILDPMSRSYIYTELDSQYWKQKLSPGTGLFVWVINRCTCMISVWSKIQIIKPSAPDNYLANQYSTDESSAQPVPADFNHFTRIRGLSGALIKHFFLNHNCSGTYENTFETHTCSCISYSFKNTSI